MTGVLKYLSVRDAFGFIQRDAGGPVVFVNVREDFSPATPRPEALVGSRVAFDLLPGRKRPRAVNVRLLR